MFGYARRDLIGRNINTLVPEPMSTVHQQYMLKYITTGKEASCAACVLVKCAY
jgi:PAS domain S-box-containing protein